MQLDKTDSPLVLLNLTGGTRSMIFAALAALQEDAREKPRRNSRAFIYASGPERVEEIWPGLGRQTLPLPQKPSPSVQSLLHDRGLVARTTEREDQDRREAARRRGDFTRALFELIASGGDTVAAERAAAMHGTIGDWLKGRSLRIEDIGRDQEVWIERACLRPPHPPAPAPAMLWDGIEAAADGSRGLLTFHPGGMALRGQAAVRYLQGGWFEEWAFLQCLDALGDQPWWNVQWSVPFSYYKDDKRTDGECDVLVAGKGTMFLLECKASVRLVPDGASIRDVRQLPRKIADWRNKIAGDRGTAAIMLLVPPRDNHQLEMLKHEAKKQDVTVWIGESGREAFMNWIGELAQIG